MNRLEKLADVYRQYFLDVLYMEAGRYWIIDTWHMISEDGLLIRRPGEDWALSIEDEGNHFCAVLCENSTTEAVCQFCFRDDDALLGIVGSLQNEVNRMIDTLPGIITP